VYQKAAAAESIMFAFNMMKIIPIDSFELKTDYPMKDLIQVLKDSIDNQERILGPSGNKVFMGIIDEKGFKFRRVPFLTISNIYYIGTFLGSNDKSNVKVRVRYFFPVYAFLLLWLFLSLIIVREIYQTMINESFPFLGDILLVLIPIAFFAIGYLFFMVPFLIDLKKTKMLLKNLLNIDVASEPRRSAGLANARR
jgi:hypothetical protein